MSNNNNLIIDQTHPSPNYDHRIINLVLHYTAINFETSLKVLTDPLKEVSAHYLIPETEMDGQRKIFQLVQEKDRAWHAGISNWKKRSNLNDTSVGIEIVNLGYSDKAGKRTWFPFTDYQIESVMEISKIIIERYQIEPTNIVGHSDIAPGRKLDPGPLFPWKKLYENGIGAWYDEKSLEIKPNDKIDIQKLQKDLKTYGYGINPTGKLDQQTQTVVQAFQMHFRQDNYSGNPDAETIAILENLIKKYSLS